MAQILGFFSNMFGYILNWIYNIDFIRNYGVAIILFTILVKVILLPITIKQQKTMKKTAKIQEQVAKIQDKYKGNQEKINQETLDLYKQEKMSPCSGCFSGIVQIILLLAVFYLVSQPLTFMRKVDKQYPDLNLVSNYIEEIKKESPNQNIMYPEINVIKQKGAQDERVNINMNFLGLDLSNVPSGALDNIKVYIIPALYVLTSIISIRISTKSTRKPKEETKDGEQTEVDLATQMNKNMSFIMPIMSVMIAMVAPLGLALYWLTNNILTIIERLCVDKFFKNEEE